MLNSNLVEWLKRLDDAKRFAVFLDDAEPSRSVRRVGWFESLRVYFSADQFENFVVDTWRNWDVAQYPGRMWNYWDIDGREEVFPKMASLGVVPSEPVLMYTHEIVQEVAFGWKQEAGIVLIEDQPPFFCEATSRSECRWIVGQDWESRERIASNVANNSELSGKLAYDGLRF